MNDVVIQYSSFSSLYTCTRSNYNGKKKEKFMTIITIANGWIFQFYNIDSIKEHKKSLKGFDLTNSHKSHRAVS